MSKISIVTAFFDIGRGDWTGEVEKNGGPLPHYLQRSVDKYIDHFTRMCELENEIIVFTSPDLASRLASISPKVKVVEYDYFSIHEELRERIHVIQSTEKFISRINPYQVRNPEYWSKDYVGVTSLKAFFVAESYRRGLITNDWASWVDFGYCRDSEHIPESKKWDFDFTPGKMHLFNYRNPETNRAMEQVQLAVLNNIVYIIGGVFAGEKAQWIQLEKLMEKSMDMLNSNGLVDDDQGLLLLSYFMEPQKFELHKMDPNAPLEDVRGILRKFNKYE
jgi:protein YibB